MHTREGHAWLAPLVTPSTTVRRSHCPLSGTLGPSEISGTLERLSCRMSSRPVMANDRAPGKVSAASPTAWPALKGIQAGSLKSVQVAQLSS